ncbi:MAG: glycosyltransferase, partial [Proteobacteria bacterium]|nr:glycosyltransferase [Pseudomonadota bacterium]
IQYLASSTQYQIPNTRYPKLIMDFCDLDSDKWLQYSQKTQFPMSLVYKMESRLLLRYEEQINQLFDNSIFVSQQEANLFQTLFPKAKNISVIPNGVDYNYFSPYQTAINEHLESSTQYPVPSTQYSTSSRPAIRNSQPTNHQSSIVNRQSSIAQHPASSAQYPVPNTQRPILLFTGAMDYHANIEGVTWFCNDVFPAVKSEFPESQFYIVGSKPHPKVRNLGSNDGVRVTGFVEDIRPYYQAADVCVIPLRLARGIQNKVLEAMAMGKAVVTTSKAIEGIRAATGKQVLVEDTPNGFSNMVLTLIKDRETRKRLGTNARQFVMKNYNWSTNMKKLDALLQA